MAQGIAVSSGQVPLTGHSGAEEWEDVMRAYRMPLGRYFASRVRNPGDIDDLIQQVFIRMFQRAQQEPIQRVPGYVFQVASSVLNDERRRAKVRHEDTHESYDDQRHDAQDEITPERVLLGEEAIHRATATIARMPELTRDVYLLRVEEECEFADIAEQLGISERSALRHMKRALQFLDDNLNGESSPSASGR